MQDNNLQLYRNYNRRINYLSSFSASNRSVIPSYQLVIYSSNWTGSQVRASMSGCFC